MAKMAATMMVVGETGKCIDVQRNAQDRRWHFIICPPVSSGLGSFSARIMFPPSVRPYLMSLNLRGTAGGFVVVFILVSDMAVISKWHISLSVLGWKSQ